MTHASRIAEDPTALPVRTRWAMTADARALTLLTAGLVAFGLAVLYSASAVLAMREGHASAFYLVRQAVGVAMGVGLFMVLAKVDAERWSRWAWPLMGVSIVLLALTIAPFTEPIAPRIHGSRRWLNLGFSLQTSEVAKLAVVVWTAMLMVKKGPRMRRLTKGLLPFLVIVGILNVLVILQPDLSTALFYTAVMGAILFAGGVRIGHFVALAMLAIPLGYREMQRLQYVMLRMSSFFDPGSAPQEVSYQLKQSLVAVGSGQLFGVGFGEGRQQLGYLPFPFSDFIASNVGEEWGLVGMLLLVGGFGAYGWFGFRIARQARSVFQQLVAIGLTVTMVLTAYLHIAVVVGLMPTTGLTLPFFSYGRSNLLLSFAITGILVNIGSRAQRVYGEDEALAIAGDPTVRR